MRLYGFLNEANKVETEISKKEFYDILKDKCSKNIKHMKTSNRWIFRGISQDEFYLKFDGNKKRKSANTSNYYTILFSELLNTWKDIPKRNRSLICTTNLANATDYGNPHLVIPYDDTQIASCNMNDFWHIVRNSPILAKLWIYKLSTFNDFFEYAGIRENKTDIKKFISKKVISLSPDVDEYNFLRYLALYTINKNPVKFEKYKNYIDLIEENKDKIKNLKINEVLEIILDPKKLNVEVKNSLREIKLNDNTEIWMDKPAILIQTSIKDEFDKFIEKI